MLAASRAGLDYYQTNFSPYQFAQFRIIEFPRYRHFAQSFPNTVPFSEGIGFIGRVKSKDDIDFTYFVTAHELGHQWWGHQLIGAQVQGSNMMSETLAEYSALHGDGAEIRQRLHAQVSEPRAGPLSARPRRRNPPRTAARPGAARALRLVSEGRA